MSRFNRTNYDRILDWSKCHICLVPAPSGVLPGWPDVWDVIACSGGGCGHHLVCTLCRETFVFVNVLNKLYVRCRNELSEEDLAMIALR